MTSLSRQDADLHFEDGSHRSTPASTAGHVLEQHEARIRRHLADHALANRPATVGLEVLGDEDDEHPDAWHLGHHHGSTLDPDAHLAASDAGWPPGISPAFVDAYNAGFNAGWDEASDEDEDNELQSSKLEDSPTYECMNCGVVRSYGPTEWIGCEDRLGASCRPRQ